MGFFNNKDLEKRELTAKIVSVGETSDDVNLSELEVVDARDSYILDKTLGLPYEKWFERLIKKHALELGKDYIKLKKIIFDKETEQAYFTYEYYLIKK